MTFILHLLTSGSYSLYFFFVKIKIGLCIIDACLILNMNIKESINPIFSCTLSAKSNNRLNVNTLHCFTHQKYPIACQMNNQNEQITLG